MDVDINTNASNFEVEIAQAGPAGLSAYQVAVKNGFVGTEQEWLDSLVGEKGDRGETGLPGEKGDPGRDGAIQYTAGDNITIDENNVISAAGSTSLGDDVKVYYINYTDNDTAYTQYFTQWLNDYKNGIKDVIYIYYNYMVGIVEPEFTYNNGNGKIKIKTSLLTDGQDYTSYGVTYKFIAGYGREATISNDTITNLVGWYLSNTFYAPKTYTKFLGTNNTSEYTPTQNYHPATKKYVDDAIASASGGEPTIYSWDITSRGNITNLWSSTIELSSSDKTFFSNTLTEYKTAHGTLAGLQIAIKGVTNNVTTAQLIWTGHTSGTNQEPFIFYYISKNELQTTIVWINGTWSGNTFTCNDTYLSFMPWNNYTLLTFDKLMQSNKETTINRVHTYSTLPESSVTPSSNNQLVNKKYVDDKLTTYTGYDNSKTQILKNINGTLTWVDE